MSSNSTTTAEKTKVSRRWAIGDKLKIRMPHHDGIEALWETKWKLPVRLLVCVGFLPFL